MKSLKSILEASVLADIDNQLKAGDEIIRKQIKDFIKHNYDITERLTISDNPNKDGKYEVSVTGNAVFINRRIASLTNGYFIFTKVDGNFSCSDCSNLTSLEGAPEKVGGYFYCPGCQSLKSLEGAPKEVGKDFYCYSCKSLISLEGAPEKVGGNFNCGFCDSLITLKGVPKKVGGNFNCDFCDSLESLKDAPKNVGGYFNCCDCKVKFTKDDVEKVSNIKREIIC